jgi:predicted nucleic acid-binding protein
MNGRFFLDTNILVYAFDRANPVKQVKAKELIQHLFESPNCFISTQVITEFCNIALKKMKPALSGEKTREFISLIPETQIRLITQTDILTAIEVYTRLSFSFWDALIISSSISSECNILYTEDLQHEMKIENGLTIINPFR